MNDEQAKTSKKWLDDAEEALNRTADSLRAAWEGTREARMSTLEAAKEAAAQLGKAIDQGIEVAREKWDPSRSDTADGQDVSPDDPETASDDVTPDD
jgi:hypothetical protein